MKNTFDFTAVNKYLNLPEAINKARFALIDYEIANHGYIPLDKAVTILMENGLSDSEKLLDELIKNNYISLGPTDEIGYLYPVSCEETDHRVKLADGREFYAMCAIDAMGCAATFGMDVEIFSYCKDTEDPVYAKITPDGISEITPANMYVSYYDSWAEGCINY